MTDNLRGIIAVLIASAAFVVNDAIVKLVSAELPSGEIIVVRGVLATILLAGGVLVLGAGRPLSVLITPMMAVRLLAAGAATTSPPRFRSRSDTGGGVICPIRWLFSEIALVAAAGLYTLHRERHGLTSKSVSVAERNPAE